jgi:hypothetical protein
LIIFDDELIAVGGHLEEVESHQILVILRVPIEGCGGE